MLKSEDIERVIVPYWGSLPEAARQTIEQASWCADEIAKRYTSNKLQEHYRLILGIIADYQVSIGKPLKFI
jgi:hypothetical protein